MRVEEFVEARIAEVVRASPTVSVLRLVAAIRSIIETQRCYADAKFPDLDGGIAEGTEMALMNLAGIWCDHSDYKEKWR